jgi:arylsulfatase A-like enzyme
MKKIIIFALLILLLLITGIYYWWNLSIGQSPKGIILISLDTLRADHLGCYGYNRDTSPSIDNFAKEGVLFEHAVVQAQWTLPSHMSIMTSLYPSSHGVKQTGERLADEHVTLAELLKKEGFQTAAFVDGGYMDGSFGFDQGFDIYDSSQGGGVEMILPKVKKWLDKNNTAPFFLFIHCFDIHNPYDPPPPYDSMFHDFHYTGNINLNKETMLAIQWKGLKVNDEDLRHFVALYDGGIRYTDEKIGEFLSYLQASGLSDQSMVIITSDHGEEFKEHGRLGHGQLYYRPNLHVPLILRYPNFLKKGIRINELVQSIDLLPTILEIAGLPAHPNAQGRSLLPLIEINKNFLNRLLWRVFHPFQKDSHVSLGMELRNNTYSIITGDYQLLHNLKANSIKLFNIESDPLATNNIAKDHDVIAERLLSELKEYYSVLPLHKASTIGLDEKTREQLEALGYIDDPVVVADDEDFDGIPDAKDNCINSPNPDQEDPDSDGFGNGCDNCPAIFNPDQRDSDRDGTGDLCEPPSRTINNLLEAEDIDTIEKPLEVANDENASKGKYIYSRNGSGNKYKPSPIMATYKVNISHAGEYVLWGRIKVSSGEDNSFFVQIDDGLNNLWEIKQGKHWQWDAVNNRDYVDPVKFDLTEGIHTIKVKLREDGTRLDALLLTNNIYFVPSGKGGIVENQGYTEDP